MRRVVPVTLAAAAAWAGCGGESGDVLAIEVRGGPAGDRTIVVSEDGRGRCNGGELTRIDGDRLIDARDIARELGELGDGARELEPGGGRAYVARVREGAVRWDERSPRKPELLARVELLALQLGRALCA